jgi:hypothetical protein
VTNVTDVTTGIAGCHGCRGRHWLMLESLLLKETEKSLFFSSPCDNRDTVTIVADLLADAQR